MLDSLFLNEVEFNKLSLLLFWSSNNSNYYCILIYCVGSGCYY